jgi:hypothetical protein
MPETETKTSPKILLIRPGSYDPNKNKIQDIIRTNIIMQDLMLKEDDQYIICGLVTMIILFLIIVSSHNRNIFSDCNFGFG